MRCNTFQCNAKVVLHEWCHQTCNFASVHTVHLMHAIFCGNGVHYQPEHPLVLLFLKNSYAHLSVKK